MYIRARHDKMLGLPEAARPVAITRPAHYKNFRGAVL